MAHKQSGGKGILSVLGVIVFGAVMLAIGFGSANQGPVCAGSAMKSGDVCVHSGGKQNSANDEEASAKRTGYICGGVGALCLLGGLATLIATISTRSTESAKPQPDPTLPPWLTQDS